MHHNRFSPSVILSAWFPSRMRCCGGTLVSCLRTGKERKLHWQRRNPFSSGTERNVGEMWLCLEHLTANMVCPLVEAHARRVNLQRAFSDPIRSCALRLAVLEAGSPSSASSLFDITCVSLLYFAIVCFALIWLIHAMFLQAGGVSLTPQHNPVHQERKRRAS